MSAHTLSWTFNLFLTPFKINCPLNFVLIFFSSFFLLFSSASSKIDTEMTDIISFWARSRKRKKGFWKVFSRMNEQTNERTIFKTENESTEGNKRCQYKWNRWRADTETMKLKDIQNLIIVDIIKLFLSFSGFFCWAICQHREYLISVSTMVFDSYNLTSKTSIFEFWNPRCCILKDKDMNGKRVKEKIGEEKIVL